jgi:hypothetical protein
MGASLFLAGLGRGPWHAPYGAFSPAVVVKRVVKRVACLGWRGYSSPA